MEKGCHYGLLSKIQHDQVLLILIEWVKSFGLVWFYGISTIVDYLMPNPVYTYTLNIYRLVWLGFMVYQLLEVI